MIKLSLIKQILTSDNNKIRHQPHLSNLSERPVCMTITYIAEMEEEKFVHNDRAECMTK